MMTLLPRDQEALQIRWDAADILFIQHRERALSALPMNHREQPDLLALGGWNNTFDLLMSLLRKKVDFDFSAIHLATGSHASQYKSIVIGRNISEYFNYLEVLRNDFTEWILDIHPHEYEPGLMNPSRDFEATLHPFKERFATHSQSIKASSFDPEIFKSVSQFVKDHPLPQPITEPIYVRVINTQGGKYVEISGQYTEQGDIYNLNQSATNLLDSTDLQKLASELQVIIDKAQPLAKTQEERNALSTLTDAKQAAQQNDRTTVGQKLASFGKETLKWIQKVGVDFSASVVAKIIEAHLGIPHLPGH
jgi:hypothetical protein